MFRLVVALALVAVCSQALRFEEAPKHVQELKGDALIQHINANAQTWTAQSYSRFADKTDAELKSHLGALKKPGHFRRRGTQGKPTNLAEAIPENFDSIQQWPQCAKIIGLIQDQSACGSCWAVSTTSAMSDRLCIASNGTIQQSISALDLMACCSFCGYQCQGGWPDEAFYQFTSAGIVTGTGYNDDAGCKPYPIAPCHLDKDTGKNKCPPEPTSDYKCEKKCQKSYSNETYKNDHYYGKDVLYFSQQNDAAIQELLANGPIVAAFNVYRDFYSYKSGIYKYTGGDYLGGHAVRIVGYGTENGTPFWKVANSWDDYWGENGYFRIIRNTNECGFEDEITTATADVQRSLQNK